MDLDEYEYLEKNVEEQQDRDGSKKRSYRKREGEREEEGDGEKRGSSRSKRSRGDDEDNGGGKRDREKDRHRSSRDKERNRDRDRDGERRSSSSSRREETEREREREGELETRESRCSSSSRSSLWEYDVFLSFRGEDTRKTFLGHLYRALDRVGIRTFRDDEELQRGKSISPELLTAIEESRFSIVVISENYAFSTWCLEELAHIVDCREKLSLGVIPVFYGVDPSHVRKQIGRFGEALAIHEEKFADDLEKVRRWRDALTEVAKISGWDWKNWNDESKFIDELVQDVSSRLFLKSSSETDNLVGMGSHMREIDSLLCMESEDVRLVGLWGMGGIGKTTIARFVYDCLSSKFQGSCFMEHVKEDFKQRGPVHLREEVLSKIFRKKNLTIWNERSGVVRERLCGKKVLVVLDDVDHVEQLDALAGRPDWFGPGSRIIITTRDKRVLDQHDVRYLYEVKLLKAAQALHLFSKYAFKQIRPLEDFMERSIEVVNYTGGLPLALKVLGLSLYRRDISDWEDTLDRLKTTSDGDVLKVLRVSYDGLNKYDKYIFLYVACFFNGEYMDWVTTVLNAFDRNLSTRLGIKLLIEKSLMSLSNKQRLWVHDLLQDMARDIICEEENPWKRKMLWDHEDISDLLAENVGAATIEIEAIFLGMSEAVDLYVSPTAFKKMPKLKLLKFYNNYIDGESKTYMPEGLTYLPSKLRYFFWDAYPLRSLPSGFRPEYLVELNLPNSSVETLWKGTQVLKNLRRMNLSNCRNLIEIPDLSKATNLVSLKLSNCESLVEVSSSVRHLSNLVELKLSNCKKLKILPNGVNLKSLRFVYLNGCTSLQEFPFISMNIEKLFLSDTSIQEVPRSIERLSRLAELRMSGCNRLKNLPDSIQNLDSLRNLGLSNCPNITIFPQVGKNIKWLYLSGTSIEKIPTSIGDRSELVYLNMSECQRLRNLPTEMQNLTRLKYLYLRGCTNVTDFPKIVGMMKALDLYGTAIEEFPSLDYSAVKESERTRCELPVLERFLFNAALKCSSRRKSRRS